jgi:hypothetical protein
MSLSASSTVHHLEPDAPAAGVGRKASFKAQMLQAREDAIIRAVNRLLSEKGFDLMTVDEVAAEVGIAKASLYNVGASLLANRAHEQPSPQANNRWQASSYKIQTGLVFVGASLLANRAL